MTVNFTNILWAAFAPKSFRQEITNPNCKHLKAVERTLVWLSISPIFYKQLFHTNVLWAPFTCLQFGFVIYWQKDFGAKGAHKMLVKSTPSLTIQNYYLGSLPLSRFRIWQNWICRSTAKHHLVPKYMFVYFVYYRYLDSEKAKLLSDPR